MVAGRCEPGTCDRLLESIKQDVRHGGSLFLALTIISRNCSDPSKPIFIVANFGNGASPEVVSSAFSDLVDNAVKMGVLVPH